MLSTTSKLFSKVSMSPLRIPFRNVASVSAPKPSGFKEKSFYEAWCSDAGAYPVMSVIGFAVVFSLGTGLYFMFSHPDSRISKYSRKQLFRGELKGIEH